MINVKIIVYLVVSHTFIAFDMSDLAS